MHEVNVVVVTTKGQIVIPSPIRTRHKIKKGTKVFFMEKGDDIILKPVTDGHIDRLKGSLRTKGAALKELLAEKERERKR